LSLLVAPLFDDVTIYSLQLAKSIEADERLEGRPILRKEYEAAVKDKQLLIFYDHGSEDTLWGTENQGILDLDNAETAPKEVYTMACLAGKSLGVALWRLGSVFWGYSDVFTFTTDSLKEFGEFAKNGLVKRREGASWTDALKHTKTLGETLAAQLVEQGKYIASSALLSDVYALVCYNGEAPGSQCTWRKLALKLFGRRGWNLITPRPLK